MEAAFLSTRDPIKSPADLASPKADGQYRLYHQLQREAGANCSLPNSISRRLRDHQSPQPSAVKHHCIHLSHDGEDHFAATHKTTGPISNILIPLPFVKARALWLNSAWLSVRKLIKKRKRKVGLLVKVKLEPKRASVSRRSRKNVCPGLTPALHEKVSTQCSALRRLYTSYRQC